MDGGFSLRFFFQLFFLAIKHPRLILLSATSSPLSPVDSYGGYAILPFFHTLDFVIASDYASSLLRLRINLMRDYESIWWEITNQSDERLRINLMRDYVRIWIIQPAVRFDRRYEWTADVYSISRSLDVCIFNCSFCWQTSTVHLYSPLRVLRRSILTAVMLGLSLYCYRVPGIRWHNNRWLALWSGWFAAFTSFILWFRNIIAQISFVFELYNPP